MTQIKSKMAENLLGGKKNMSLKNKNKKVTKKLRFYNLSVNVKKKRRI